ncbi:hypothetical protein NSTC745_06362 [Nostoc sp. DSM 114161]|jgi:hypothetical protein|uniref:hypothetical protein n=1 Tax=Nostoc sp. DSM 114161 TaxID=3440143 RepID=UPI0040454728
MTGQTEPIKISSLQERYRLDSRQAVYDRINGLKIEPIARGKISSEQLELLDKLDIHIRSGGAIADFPLQPEVQAPALDKLDKLDKLDIEPDQATVINVMANLMEKMITYAYARHPSPLASYEELEKAIANKWLLPSSKVKELIGVTTIPKTVKEPKEDGDAEFFVRGNFLFVKIGKIGRETSWAVAKPTHGESSYLLN